MEKILNIDLGELAAHLLKEDFTQYERYGSATEKDKFTIPQFFSLMGDYYDVVKKQEKVNHFFRNGAAQTKFRKINKLKKKDAADHIISTGVFRTILEKYGAKTDLTYDYWASIKTTMNQCWNFQNILKTENQAKAVVEVKLMDVINKGTFATADSEVKNLVTTIRDTINNSISKGKVFFSQAKRIRGHIDSFLADFDLEEINWDPLKKKQCCCDLCTYCKDHSGRWRYKYFVILQKRASLKDIQKTFEDECLRFIIKKCCEANLEEYYNKIKKLEITNIKELHFYLNNNTNRNTKEDLLKKVMDKRAINRVCGFLNKKRKPNTLLEGAKVVVGDPISILLPKELIDILKKHIKKGKKGTDSEWHKKFKKALSKVC